MYCLLHACRPQLTVAAYFGIENTNFVMAADSENLSIHRQPHNMRELDAVHEHLLRVPSSTEPLPTPESHSSAVIVFHTPQSIPPGTQHPCYIPIFWNIC